MKKLCVITGTRAEYGLLYRLMRLIQNSADFELQVVVTGMHLSPEFGLTYRQIEEDGFEINKKVEALLSSDTSVGIGKSIALGIASFVEVFDELEPDLLLILGDRFEIFSAAVAALTSGMLIAHIHGGEVSEGSMDEAFRHAITKMSHYHFTSTEVYRKRVIQMGENPNLVFNVGALGVENIKEMDFISREELGKELGFCLKNLNFIVTYHPVTLDNNSARTHFLNLLNALESYKKVGLVFTKPNADKDGRVIATMIDKFVDYNNNAIAFTSLGSKRYLSLMKQVNLVVGNSSSGLIEAPSFNVPTVNIGDRQKGRMSSVSTIHCGIETEEIISAIDRALSKEFKMRIKNQSNPYDNGKNASSCIVDILNKADLNRSQLKKKFFDIKYVL